MQPIRSAKMKCRIIRGYFRIIRRSAAWMSDAG
jgi:hypothetical protein